MIPAGQVQTIRIQLRPREAGGYDVFFLDVVTGQVVLEASITEPDINAAKAWAVARGQELVAAKWISG